MENKKFKEKLHDIETQDSSASEYCPTEDKDPIDYPFNAKKKKKKKKKSIMQIKSTKMVVSRKPKSPLSKDKQAYSDNSKKSGSITRKRTQDTDLYENVEAKFSVMERADRVLERIGKDQELPFFLKRMLPSNVSHGFWLHLPKRFCNVHLPDHDTSIILVDEWGNEYKTSYFLERHGLSAGWRGFSIAHRLLKGDILIFHLTGPCKLQVHIVRVNGSDVISAALCLMNMGASRRGTDADDGKKNKKKRKRTTKFVEPFLPDISTPSEIFEAKNVQDQSASNSDDGYSSEPIEGRPSPKKPLRYPEPSFLHEHPREGVVCR